MARKLSNSLKEYLRSRRKVLGERPEKIRVFLENIVKEIGSVSTIIVFGGRGVPDKLFSNEPRDLDLLIITSDDKEVVEEKIYSLRPRGLPLDVIVLNLKEYRENTKLIKEMIKKSIIIHDGLKLFSKSK